MSKSVLLVTLPPTKGGVPTKTRILAEFLRRRGHAVSIAHYATMSEFGAQSAPSWEMLRGKSASVARGVCFDDFPSYAVGCTLPELEFSYYRTTDRWRSVISGFDRHIAVGGTVLVSNPLADMNIPHMTWCASTMIDDRYDRRQAMPMPRRFIDVALVGPIQGAMERKILARPTHFMTVSDYARDTLIAAGGTAENFMTVPVPVDLNHFSPPDQAPVARIGFAGRADDPRKNIGLLLQAFRIIAARDPDAELILTGDASPKLQHMIGALGISDKVTWRGWLDRDGLAEFYRSLDVFVFPSAKEGLGIAGIEAMAAGVPVISTRAGGTEDFVIEGETGHLVGSTPTEMADAIAAIYTHRAERDRMSLNARQLIADKYSMDRFEENIAVNWQKTWGDGL